MATYKKTKDSSGNRIYTKIVNGDSSIVDEAEFNAAKKRLKSYAAKYKIKKGDLTGKKLTYQQKYKYDDNATGAKKHKPKWPATTIKGGWGVNNTQAGELYNDNPGHLKRTEEIEIWTTVPTGYNIPDEWSEPRGIPQYGGKIDPPGGFPVVLRKTREGTSTEDRVYKKITGGTTTDSNKSYYDSSKKRLKQYTSVYKIKKGPLTGKKITVKQDFKYKDTVNGKQKHRPKPTVIEIKGGWGVTDEQAVDLYANNQGKLTIKSQAELWDVLPETYTIPGWFYGEGGSGGFEQYIGIIDPPAGYQIPYGDSDVFEIIGTRDYQSEILDTIGVGTRSGYLFNRVWLMFDTSPGHICNLIPDLEALEAAGFVAGTDGSTLDNTTRFSIFDPTPYNGVTPDGSAFREWVHLALPEYKDNFPYGWYVNNQYSDAYTTDSTGAIYRTLRGVTTELDPDEVYAADTFAPGELRKWQRGWIPGQDDLSHLTIPTPGLMIETKLYAPVNQHMKDWRDCKFTTPFKAHSLCGVKNLYPATWSEWYDSPSLNYNGFEVNTVAKMSNGTVVDVCALDEQYPWKNAFPYTG